MILFSVPRIPEMEGKFLSDGYSADKATPLVRNTSRLRDSGSLNLIAATKDIVRLTLID